MVGLIRNMILVGTIGVVGITPGTEPRMPESACRCSDGGEEHEFPNLGCFASCMKALEEGHEYDAFNCIYAPEEHPGCHANLQNGSCGEHEICMWSLGTNVAATAIGRLMAAGNEGAVIKIVRQADPAGRLRINPSRNGIEIMDCRGERPIGFFAASVQLQREIRKWTSVAEVSATGSVASPQ
jgi:hypothetical protein